MKKTKMVTGRKHKIPGVGLDVCCAEQKVAYNYLFAYYGKDRSALEYIRSDLERRKETDMRPFDTNLIYRIICDNFDRYTKDYFIATSYEQIGSRIPCPDPV